MNDPINIFYALIVVILIILAGIIFAGGTLSMMKPSLSTCKKYIPQKISIILPNSDYTKLIKITQDDKILKPIITQHVNDGDTNNLGHLVTWYVIDSKKINNLILQADNSNGDLIEKDIKLDTSKTNIDLIIKVPRQKQIYTWDLISIICRRAPIDIISV
jgi:hypothetical protein